MNDEQQYVEVDEESLQARKEELQAALHVVKSDFLTSAKAAEYCGISNPHFRAQLRAGKPGSELITTYKLAGKEFFMTLELDEYKAFRAKAKAERQANKAAKRPRRASLINLNLLRVLAQQLNIDGYSRMAKDPLKEQIESVLVASGVVEEPVNISEFDFSKLMLVVAEAAAKAHKDDVEDDGSESADVDEFLV